MFSNAWIVNENNKIFLNNNSKKIFFVFLIICWFFSIDNCTRERFNWYCVWITICGSLGWFFVSLLFQIFLFILFFNTFIFFSLFQYFSVWNVLEKLLVGLSFFFRYLQATLYCCTRILLTDTKCSKTSSKKTKPLHSTKRNKKLRNKNQQEVKQLVYKEISNITTQQH